MQHLFSENPINEREFALLLFINSLELINTLLIVLFHKMKTIYKK